MKNHEIKKKVKEFRSTFASEGFDCAGLKAIAKKLGYSIVEYNHLYNDDAVQTVVDSLKLSEQIQSTKGFVYADRNHRLIFIHEDLSEQETQMLLAHECGHIFLDHLSTPPIIGKDVAEEYEANEFAHYLLNRSVFSRLFEPLRRHKKLVTVLAVVLLTLAVGSVSYWLVRMEYRYYGEYYVTATGNKYHQANCIFVKSKTNVRRLTKEEFESGSYDPCDICLP